MFEPATLIAAALAVRNNAYAPYSDFLVGVAIEDETGQMHIGCNVENAAFPNGICAESGAIGAMIASGAKTIRQIAIVGGPRDDLDFPLCVPCGGCRQRIVEVGTSATQILLADSTGAFEQHTIEDLLPKSFHF